MKALRAFAKPFENPIEAPQRSLKIKNLVIYYLAKIVFIPKNSYINSCNSFFLSKPVEKLLLGTIQNTLVVIVLIYSMLMRAPKRPFVFCSKIQSFTVVPKDHSFSFSEIRNFTVVPKRYSFFHGKIRNFKVVPKRRSVFSQRNTNFENCTQTAIPVTAIRSLTKKSEIFKVVPKLPFVF